MPHHRVRAHTRLAPAAAAALVLAAGCAAGPSEQADSGDASSGAVGRVIKASGPSGHQLRQIPADGAPQVRLQAAPDPHGGWNLHLRTKRFSFTPESVNQKVQPNEGHAHLYIDGEKHTRIYSPWFFLPADAVPEGKHTLKVTLNANDHTTWATGENAISATTQITSTGETGGHHHGDDEHSHAGQQSSGGTHTAAPADVTIKATVTDGQVSPPPHRVTIGQGQTLRLVVISDHPDRVHIHGYDLEQPVRPDSPAVFTFTADTAGVFEVETHQSGLQLLQLQIQ